MEDKFQSLDSEQGDVVITFNNATFKLSKLVSVMSEVIVQNKLEVLNNKFNSQGCGQLPCFQDDYWLRQGVNCQVLKPGKSWQKGKARIKVTLEFFSNEPEIEQTPEIKKPESPLDDLRRKINEATS
ncbi:hypothetical protein FJR11_02385 [Anabaena sp. UHCC 0187]|uniref:KGK domain-containing protein n=1 Tax=Anabaena sp. UHCC 0187 TaxID=2590018 RepID=UPI0014489DB2|nr:KGK domain-containing protein [Anabaena sp. UHCC 0187]MTJ11462.1 hypothetical protein [Anabaena sp. UHCC 0187]